MNIEASYAKSDRPIKNGTAVTSCNRTGHYNTNNNSITNKPILDSFKSKWADRFHNGILVEVVNGNLLGV